MYGRFMTAREYTCTLMRPRTPLFAANFWEPAGEPLPCRIDFDSWPSQVDALLYAMRQNRGREQYVERYRLQVQESSGSVFRTIGVSAPELERHNAGYPEGAGPVTQVATRATPRECRSRVPATSSSSPSCGGGSRDGDRTSSLKTSSGSP
jgi:hypothetical protein